MLRWKIKRSRSRKGVLSHVLCRAAGARSGASLRRTAGGGCPYVSIAASGGKAISRRLRLYSRAIGVRVPLFIDGQDWFRREGRLGVLLQLFADLVHFAGE